MDYMQSKRPSTKALKVADLYGRSQMSRWRMPSRDNAGRMEYLYWKHSVLQDTHPVKVVLSFAPLQNSHWLEPSFQLEPMHVYDLWWSDYMLTHPEIQAGRVGSSRRQRPGIQLVVLHFTQWLSVIPSKWSTESSPENKSRQLTCFRVKPRCLSVLAIVGIETWMCRASLSSCCNSSR